MILVFGASSKLDQIHDECELFLWIKRRVPPVFGQYRIDQRLTLHGLQGWEL